MRLAAVNPRIDFNLDSAISAGGISTSGLLSDSSSDAKQISSPLIPISAGRAAESEGQAENQPVKPKSDKVQAILKGIKQGFLDDQFKQLQMLADESSPDFVHESVVTLFFQTSDKLIENLAKALEKPDVDFNQVSNHAHQFRGSSSSDKDAQELLLNSLAIAIFLIRWGKGLDE